MSVRFNGSGANLYSTSSGLPTPTLFTVTLWAYISVDTNGFSTFVRLVGATNAWLQTASDGITPILADETAARATGTAMTVGEWYRLGAVVNGTSSKFYQATATAVSTTETAVSAWTAASSASALRIGASSTTAEPLNGRIAALKLWDNVALTKAEIDTELAQFAPVRTANLQRFHRFLAAETTDYSGNGNTLTAGTGATTEDGPPIPWGSRRRSRVSPTPQVPTVDAGKDVFGTAGFEFAIQAVESGLGITARSWTVVSGPAEVAAEIGTTSLLSWFPATAGVYELEYRVTNPAGQAYDTVYATVNSTGTIVNPASVSGTGTTLTCGKPTGTAQGDILLATQSGDFNDFDLMDPPIGWQPLFAYDVGMDSLHVKGWTLTAGASEPASYDFTQGTGSAGTVTIVAMRGVVEAGVRYEITPDASTTAARTCPDVAGAVPGSILLCGATTDPGATRTWTPPTGMTEQADVQSGTNTTHSVASLLNPADPTGTNDFTLSGTTAAPGGIQWSAVFPMPADPQRRGANKSMIAFVKTS